jgi:hypothetical protein
MGIAELEPRQMSSSRLVTSRRPFSAGVSFRAPAAEVTYRGDEVP